MKTVPLKFFFLLVFNFLLLGSQNFSAYAQGTINCHCFKDREYQPEDRFAADEYILATSFNSLLAKFFAVSKGQIIMLKMNQGVPQDDLLVGLKVSRLTGEDSNRLLGLRRAGKTWQEIIIGLEQKHRFDNDRLLESIRDGLPVEQAGSGIADEIISRFFNVPLEEVNRLRKAGLNEKELALLFILVHAGGRKTATLLEQHDKYNKSWSQIAHDLGVEPAAAGKLILAYPNKQLTE